LSVVPCEPLYDNDSEAARYIAGLYAKDKNLQWALIDHSTIHKGEYIFIAE